MRGNFQKTGRRGSPKLPEWTDEQIAKVETLAGYGMAIKDIAAFYSVTPASFHVALNKHPELRVAIDRGRAKALSKVSQTAYQMAVDGEHPQMTQFWLKTQGGWHETTIVEHRVEEESAASLAEVLMDEFETFLSKTIDVTPMEPVLLDEPKAEENN